MADTQILKERLRAQIAALEEKLRAVETVERLSVELGLNGTATPASEPHRPVSVPRTPLINVSVIDLCKKIALTMPEDTEWHVGKMFPFVQTHGRPDAERTNVGTSMKRLFEAGFFDVTRRDVVLGNIYRRKRARPE